MKISIIIPAYNVEKYLDQCLGSCFRQDLNRDEYEVIVVNDGSKDKTLEIAEEWQKTHENIIIISQENKGLSEARNAGTSAASGEYLMYIDSDDWIRDDCLGPIYRQCIYDKLDMLILYGARVINGKPYRIQSFEGRKKVCTGRDLMRMKMYVFAQFAVYRRDFLETNSLRFHPGIFHEDNEFTPRAYYHAERVGYTEDIIYYLRQTPGSITRSVNPKKITDLMTVADRLADFAETQADLPYRSAVYRQAATCINMCLKELNRLGDNNSELLHKIYLSRKRFFGYYLKSDSPLHKIEGVILHMFPRQMLGIHKILDRVHYRERRLQAGIAGDQ